MVELAPGVFEVSYEGEPHCIWRRADSQHFGCGQQRVRKARAGGNKLAFAFDRDNRHANAARAMMMHMVGAFAEFERAMLRERTRAGLEAARREGRVGGRRPKLTPQQQAEIIRMVSKGTKTAADAARLFGVHPGTISRLLFRARAATGRQRAAARS